LTAREDVPRLVGNEATSKVTAFGPHAAANSLTTDPGASITGAAAHETSDPLGSLFHFTDARRYRMT
jgi:hypothetical protein